MKRIGFLLLLMPYFALEARVVQILHTNDLHSYFEGTRAGQGGYARLKTIIDELRAEATRKGIPTFHFDGGDFGEGSTFYFSDQGVDALRALDHLGVDAAVLGNHDYMFGGPDLRRQILEAKLKTPILSANIVGKRALGLRGLIPDFVDFELDGLKLRVFGLTTTEIHFQYPFRPQGFISSSHRAGIDMAQRAEREGVDFLIALTHTGHRVDEILVRNSFSIDLVIGGHDHILFETPRMVENLWGRAVPILQAGAHGTHIGSFLIDILPGGKSTILDYRVYPITTDIPEDQDIKRFVAEAHEKRERYLGRSWKEIIGFTEIPLTGNYNGIMRDKRSCWSRHMARLTRLTAKADLGLQWDVFQGEEIAPGVVTFGDMVDNFPHINRWGDKGWSVSRARVPGFVLKAFLRFLSSRDERLDYTIDGLYARTEAGAVPFDFALHRAEDATLALESIKSAKYYTIGLPSEIPFAMKNLARLTANFLLGFPSRVENGHFWPVLEEYIRTNSPLRCLED
jgi:5'-nucleotidase / UDP-sugar diphosphatase